MPLRLSGFLPHDLCHGRDSSCWLPAGENLFSFPHWDSRSPLLSGVIFMHISSNTPFYPSPLVTLNQESDLVHKEQGSDTCTPMFITALFTIARTWKPPRCPLTVEWIKKLQYIYTMEYYSAIKRDEFESILLRWMNLQSCYTECSKSKREKQISHNKIYMEYRHMVLMNLFAR